MSYLSYTKGMPGVADVFLRDPALYAPMLEFIERVMTRPSDLSKADREMIAEHVSRINGCDFCVGAHRWTLAALDVDWETIDALALAPETDKLSRELLAMLRFAGKLTSKPEKVGEDDIAELVREGWSEQAIEDAINVVSLFSYVNRLVDALGIEGNENYFRMVGKSLAEKGYAPLLESALKKAS